MNKAVGDTLGRRETSQMTFDEIWQLKLKSSRGRRADYPHEKVPAGTSH